MDFTTSYCVNFLRAKIAELLAQTETTPEENNQVLHELSELREALDDLMYMLIML
jgi:hypothetical protein